MNPSSGKGKGGYGVQGWGWDTNPGLGKGKGGYGVVGVLGMEVAPHGESEV